MNSVLVMRAEASGIAILNLCNSVMGTHINVKTCSSNFGFVKLPGNTAGLNRILCKRTEVF